MDFSSVLSDRKALQKAITAKSKGGLGSILRNKFVDSILYTLQKAWQLNSPTVYCMSKSIRTTPWCMDDLLRYIDMTLRKIDSNLKPVVASKVCKKEPWDDNDDFSAPSSDWILYKDYEYLHQQKIQENIRLVAVSGLQEFIVKNRYQEEILEIRQLQKTADNKETQKASDKIVLGLLVPFRIQEAHKEMAHS
ncbi:hypothetical protein G6F68_015227 [Rhizopus microsporus]|nr:hypothetical protein G6F68_015227 [Rhizopus microsporus]